MTRAVIGLGLAAIHGLHEPGEGHSTFIRQWPLERWNCVIYELATVDVLPGHESDFEDGVRKAKPLFEAAQGFCSIALRRSIESPNRYLLIVGWDTVDDHMVHFRNSPAFGEWRSLVGPHFAAVPSVEHVADIDLA